VYLAAQVVRAFMPLSLTMGKITYLGKLSSAGRW